RVEVQPKEKPAIDPMKQWMSLAKLGSYGHAAVDENSDAQSSDEQVALNTTSGAVNNTPSSVTSPVSVASVPNRTNISRPEDEGTWEGGEGFSENISASGQTVSSAPFASVPKATPVIRTPNTQQPSDDDTTAEEASILAGVPSDDGSNEEANILTGTPLADVRNLQ
ncbi:MAG: hypothetical protein SFU25_01515, partial [Candidatus Caenarcaniphilales bacterium]|nr:hypothetical protein [Candidatus Caenarcaniphilales bacterium]